MAEPRISALIIARDEAAHLAECIASVRWADEVVVVVDAASRDDTERIARAQADQACVRHFDTFAAQRNHALTLARGEWVIAIDADERSSPEQAAEVRGLISNPAQPFSGFRVPIRSVILGRGFTHSGTQNDRPLRLFQRSLGRWVGEVHETVELSGQIGSLETPLSHQTLADIRTFLIKIDRYTTLEAIRLQRERRPIRLADLTLRPLWTFAKLYLGKQGFRDGIEGFMFCALSGMSVCVRHWKHRELVRLSGGSNP